MKKPSKKVKSLPVDTSLGNMPDVSPHDFSQSFMYLIHQMHFLVQKHLEQVLAKEKSLTFSQFMILVGFKCPHSGSISQATIASELELTEATVSRHIGSLVKLGYIKREEDSENRRKHKLSMTPRGALVFNKTLSTVDSELTSLFSVIDNRNKDVITKSFKRVLDSLLSRK